MKQLTSLLVGLLAVAGLAVAAGFGSGFSGATFVSQSSNTSSVTASTDWTPPTVTLSSPGGAVQGTVTLAATASDGESGIASVSLQYLAPGATAWTTVCTDATAPYSCAWDTTAVADGDYDLRARATDNAGYLATSSIVRTVVANQVLVVLSNPGEAVRGNVALSAQVHNSLLTWTVRIEYAVAGTDVWKTLCTGLSAPFGCTWATTGYANDSYDLRAVATSLGRTAYSAVVTDVQVDNAAPSVTLVDPGTPLRGTVTFAATATDAHSGVAQVSIQYSRAGGAYQALCTVTVEPYSCRYATTTLPDGTYSFRAVATDVAGNTTTSAVVGNRVIDNTVSSVSVDDPGAYLSGTAVAVTAQANSTAGVTSVRIQRAPSGTTTWTDLCTDTTAPYSCTWNTTQVADGLYDLRAVLTDGRGALTTSAVVAGRRVDNSPLRALDVQTANGEGTAGRVDAGDVMTLTYSEGVAPGSISAGWTGAAIPVTLRLRDGNLVGLGNRGDTLDVLRGNAAVQLGSVALREDYVKSRKTVTFNATMTATTQSDNGINRTVVTIRVGTVASGSGLRTLTTPSAMVWTPSTAATGVAGGACSAAPATESGAADREF